jgi:hypothetical protein
VKPRIAGALSVVTGLGFGLPGIPGLVHLAREGEVWTFMGFPTYGDGPFESAGIDSTPALLGGFLAVCAAEVGVGVALWRGRGRTASLALLPFELAYWIGYALPFGPLLGAGRTALVLASRSTSDSVSPTATKPSRS